MANPRSALRSLSIGKKRHRVSLDAVTGRTADGRGGYTDVYTALSPPSVKARIEPATPSDVQRLVGNTVTATVSHIVTMRYHADVTEQTRLTFGTRVLYVRGRCNVEERNIELQLACEERVTKVSS